MQNPNPTAAQDEQTEMALLEQAGWFRGTNGEQQQSPPDTANETRPLPKTEKNDEEAGEPRKPRFSLDPRKWGSRTQAAASLFLCLLSSIYGFIFLIPAIYLAHKSRKASKAAPGIDGASFLSMFALIVSYFLALLAFQNILGNLLFLANGLN